MYNFIVNSRWMQVTDLIFLKYSIVNILWTTTVLFLSHVFSPASIYCSFWSTRLGWILMKHIFGLWVGEAANNVILSIPNPLLSGGESRPVSPNSLWNNMTAASESKCNLQQIWQSRISALQKLHFLAQPVFLGIWRTFVFQQGLLENHRGTLKAEC